MRKGARLRVDWTPCLARH